MATPKEAAVLWIRDKLYQGRKEFEHGGVDRTWLASQIQAHYPHYELTDAKLRKIAAAYRIEEARIVKRLEKYLKTRGSRHDRCSFRGCLYDDLPNETIRRHAVRWV